MAENEQEDPQEEEESGDEQLSPALQAAAAEIEEEAARKRREAGLPPGGGGRSMWNPYPWKSDHDPILTDKQRAMEGAEYNRRNIRAVHTLMLSYSQGILGSGDEADQVRRVAYTRLVELHFPEEVRGALDPKLLGYNPLVLKEGTQLEDTGLVPIQDTLNQEGWVLKIYDENGELVTDEVRQDDTLLVAEEARLWTYSIPTTQPGSRKAKGIYELPLGLLVDRWHQRLVGAGFSEEPTDPNYYGRPYNELSQRERDSIFFEYYWAAQDVAKGWDFEAGKADEKLSYFKFENCWQAHQLQEVKKDEYKAQGLDFNNPDHCLDGHPDHRVRMVSFTTDLMMADWKYAQDAAAKIPDERHEGLVSDYDLHQTAKETVDAEEVLADMVSFVVRRPSLAVKTNDKGEIKVDVVHSEIVVAADTYDIAKRRKWCAARPAWLEQEGGYALAIVSESDARKLRNDWGFGPIPDRTARQVRLFGLSPVDMRCVAGTYTDKPGWFKTPDGPRLAGINQKIRHEVGQSFADLEHLVTRIFDEKDVVKRSELKDKFNFIQWEKDDLFWTYWEKTRDGEKPHSFEEWAAQPEGWRNWEPHVTVRENPALWGNGLWVVQNDHLHEPQLADNFNTLCRRNGVGIRISYEDPGGNFYRHQDVAYDAWRRQPLENIREKADHLVDTLNEVGEWTSLRNEVVKFFAELPTRHDDRPDVTRLFEKYLKWADEQALFLMFWFSVEDNARFAEGGDVKGLLKGGWWVFPTDGLAEEYPDVRWGAPYRAAEQYNPFDYKGQQKARAALLFLGYDNMVVSTMKGIVEKIHAGGTNFTWDDVLGDMLSGLGSRRLYWTRFQALLGGIGKHFSIITGKAKDVLGQMLGKENHEASKEIDEYGVKIVRNVVGETNGDGGIVDAILAEEFIKRMRERLPGA